MRFNFKAGDLVITRSPFEKNYALVLEVIGEGDLTGLKVMMPSMTFTCPAAHVTKVTYEEQTHSRVSKTTPF